MIKIAPSILAADFSKLGDEINSISNADYIHFDVMDGIFVPNLSFGFPVLEAVRRVTDKILDVHLMIDTPSRYISRFIKAGADILTFHAEAQPPECIPEIIDDIHNQGKKAGLSVKPATPAGLLFPYINMLDLVLVMTVEPGYGGQAFMPSMLDKVKTIRDHININNLNCELEVDGGINPETATRCINAGANVLVAGVDVFGAVDRKAQIELLKNCNG